MNLEDLYEASYKGAMFFTKSSTVIGGRKIALKVPIDSDLQLVEDLGLSQRKFSLTGYIASRRDNNGNVTKSYQDVRSSLLDALEEGGPGILVHPFYGRIEDLVAVTFSLNEHTGNLGVGDITITFEKTLSDGLPQITTVSITKISNGSTLVNTLSQTLIGKFLVTLADNFAEGVTKLEDYSDQLTNLIKPLSSGTNKFESYVRDLTNFRTNIPILVNSPSIMATRVTLLMGNVLGLTPIDSTNKRVRLDAFKVLFDYGDDDVPLAHSTFQSTQKQNNRDALNTPIKGMALANAYLSASNIKFETVAEIEAESDSLELQYQKLAADTSTDPEMLDGLTDLRLATQEYFDEQKLTARQTIVVRVNPTSTRLLAYQYYGSSELGEEIAELNSLQDSAYVQGDLKILTV